MVVRSQVQAKTKPEKSGGGGEEKQATTASAPLRGMEFAAATSWLEPGAAESRTAPPPEPTAPVQAKLTGALPKPSLKQKRLLGMARHDFDNDKNVGLHRVGGRPVTDRLQCLHTVLNTHDGLCQRGG